MTGAGGRKTVDWCEREAPTWRNEDGEGERALTAWGLALGALAFSEKAYTHSSMMMTIFRSVSDAEMQIDMTVVTYSATLKFETCLLRCMTDSPTRSRTVLQISLHRV